MRLILEDQPNIDIIIEVGNGQGLLDAIAVEEPDVVLLDLKMPVMDGIEATQQIKAHYPEIKVLLLSMHDDERLISHLMNLGANGYLLKDEEPEVVCKAVSAVHEKGFFFNDYTSKALLNGVKNCTKISSVNQHRNTELTKREVEILHLICQKYTTADIAKELYISIRTVDGHRRNLQDKTGVKNVAGLVIYAIRNGIVKL